jgi:antitoxin HicB
MTISPALLKIKTSLYNALKEQGVSHPELARRLGVSPNQVARHLSTIHNTPVPDLEKAFHAIGLRLELTLTPLDDHRT